MYAKLLFRKSDHHEVSFVAEENSNYYYRCIIERRPLNALSLFAEIFVATLTNGSDIKQGQLLNIISARIRHQTSIILGDDEA